MRALRRSSSSSSSLRGTAAGLALLVLLEGCAGAWPHVNDIGVVKSIFLETDVDRILAIREHGPDKEIVVLGLRAAAIFDADTLDVVRRVRYADVSLGSNPEVIDLEHGHLGIILGGGGYNIVGIREFDGPLLWKFAPEGVQSYRMVGADLSADGVPELYVASSAGLFRLDPEGDIVWHQPGLVREVVPLPEGDDGRRLLLAARSTDRAWDFRDGDGNLVRTVRPDRLVYGPTLVNWENEIGLISRSGQYVYLHGLDGSMRWRQRVPFTVFGHDAQAIVIEDESPLVAILAHSRLATFRRGVAASALIIVDTRGVAVYQERLPLARSIYWSNRREALLVGLHDGTILEYAFPRGGGP